MRRLGLAVVCLPLVLLPGPTVHAGGKPAEAPAVVVRVKSLDALLGNVKLVVGLIGQEKEAHKIEALIKSKIGAKGLEGADPARPFGIYVRFGKSFDDTNGAILVPIADEKAFLKLLDNAGVAYVKDKDGIYTHKLDKNVDLYFRFAHNYLYITSVSTAGIQTRNLPDPAKALAVPGAATIVVLARVDQIPLGVKDELLLKPIIDAIDAAEKIAQPGETKTQNEFRLAALHDLKQFAASIVKDAAEIRFDLDVSDKTNELAVSLDIKARPGSGLAKTFKNLGDLKSPLGSIVDRDTAFLGGTHIVLPDALSQAFIKVVREARDGALKGIQDDVKKAQAKSLFDSLMPTAEAGEFQMVVAAVGPKQERYALLGALKLKDGAKLGKTVFDLLTNARENIPKDQRDKVKVPLKSVGAVMIHRFELPKDVAIDKFLDGIVGPERYLYLAFRNDAMFLGLGKESETLPALESAIGKTQNAASSPLAFTVDVARLAPLLARTENQKDLATRQFPSGSTGRLRLTLDGGASLTLRLQMGLNVLEFLVKMKDLKE